MKSIQALREERQQLAKEARNQLEQKGDRVWSTEDQKVFDERDDKIQAIEREMDSIEKLIKAEAEKKADLPPTDVKPEAKKAREAFAKMIRIGDNKLSAEELALIRNTMSTTTGSQGGNTVASVVAAELIEAIKGFKGIREVASQITTTNGAPMSFPTSDGTGEVGELVAENAAAAALDPSFGTAAVNAYKFGSKSIAIPIELIQDSTVDIVAFLYKRIRERLGRIMNQKFTIGSGSSEPMGLITASTAGKVGATGQTTTIIYDDIMDLIEAVDYAYGNLKFMTSQSGRKMVRKLKDTSNRPLWSPSYEAGISAGLADQLAGYDVVLNNDVAVPAANAKSLAFGQLDQYMVRDAMDVTIFRFEDSAFMLKGQIGFVAWARAGGNLLDTTGVKHYQHAAT